MDGVLKTLLIAAAVNQIGHLHLPSIPTKELERLPVHANYIACTPQIFHFKVALPNKKTWFLPGPPNIIILSIKIDFRRLGGHSFSALDPELCAPGFHRVCLFESIQSTLTIILVYFQKKSSPVSRRISSDADHYFEFF
jgi:hypothetical protein